MIQLTKMSLQECQRGFVDQVHGNIWVDVSFQLHQLAQPISRQEGEVRKTLVHCTPVEAQEPVMQHAVLENFVFNAQI